MRRQAFAAQVSDGMPTARRSRREHDREVPVACGEALARAWSGATLVKTKGLGHTRILRDATTLETVVRFVAQGQADNTTTPTDPRSRS